MARLYARVAGPLLLLLGVAGLLSGGRPLFGALNVDPAENLWHLVSGALLLYAGFVRRGGALSGVIVYALGVAYAILGIVGILLPDVFGLFPSGLSLADDLIHVALGASGIAAAELTRAGPAALGAPKRPTGDGTRRAVTLAAAVCFVVGPMLVVFTGGPGVGALIFSAGLVLLGARAMMGDGDRALGRVLVVIGALTAAADLVRMFAVA